MNRKTYPVATDSDVKNDVHRGLCEGCPHLGVTDLGSSDLVELLAVRVPSDALVLEVGALAVDLDAPNVELVVVQGGVASKANGLVADATRVCAAVGNTDYSSLSVDVLEDVEFTTGRPSGSLAEGIAHHPKGGPETLLVLGGVSGNAKRGLHPGDLASFGSDGKLRLDSAGCPSLRSRSIRAGDDLQGTAATVLDVGNTVGVPLEFVVVVLIAGHHDPVARRGLSVGGTDPVCLPFSGVARVCRRIAG